MPEIFVYGMINRPAGYATCPEKRLVELDSTHHEYPNGTAAYDRRLMPEDLYRFEMAPVSDNAYQFAIGERVLVNECDDAVVVGHEYLGRYSVRYDSTGAIDNVHVKQLEEV